MAFKLNQGAPREQALGFIVGLFNMEEVPKDEPPEPPAEAPELTPEQMRALERRGLEEQRAFEQGRAKGARARVLVDRRALVQAAGHAQATPREPRRRPNVRAGPRRARAPSSDDDSDPPSRPLRVIPLPRFLAEVDAVLGGRR